MCFDFEIINVFQPITRFHECHTPYSCSVGHRHHPLISKLVCFYNLIRSASTFTFYLFDKTLLPDCLKKLNLLQVPPNPLDLARALGLEQLNNCGSAVSTRSPPQIQMVGCCFVCILNVTKSCVLSWLKVWRCLPNSEPCKVWHSPFGFSTLLRFSNASVTKWKRNYITFGETQTEYELSETKSKLNWNIRFVPSCTVWRTRTRVRRCDRRLRKWQPWSPRGTMLHHCWPISLAHWWRHRASVMITALASCAKYCLC